MVAHFTNQLGYSASYLGSHEFDGGDKEYNRFIKSVSYPMLACNLDLSNNSLIKGVIESFQLLTITFKEITRTVGITGYVTPQKKNISNSDDGVIFLDEITSLQDQVDKLKLKGIDIIIAIGHSGYEKDMEIARKVSM